MSRARFMNSPEDCAALGINPTTVEPWEDARRDTNTPGTTEVWYFDAALDDGTKVIVGIQPKAPEKASESHDSPRIQVQITPPDGQLRKSIRLFDVADSSISTEKCELTFGANTLTGDFSSYDVYIEPEDGVGVDLRYEALTEPFRQGSGIIALGDDDEYHYTDLSVPKNKVTGTITVDGVQREVTGFGYHDHQWMNISPVRAFHHWIWGRLFAGEYTVMIYDFVASAEFNYTRLPMFGVFDGAGKKIFEGDGTVESEFELYHDEEFDKDQPKTIVFHFANGDMKASLKIGWHDIIERRNTYNYADDRTKAMFDKMGMQPTYTRFAGYGELTLVYPDGTTDSATGDMIYEFPFNGKPDPLAHM